jgi:hypothetical protein
MTLWRIKKSQFNATVEILKEAGDSEGFQETHHYSDAIVEILVESCHSPCLPVSP